MVHTGSGAHPASHSMSTRILSRGGAFKWCSLEMPLYYVVYRLVGFVPRTLLPSSPGNNSLSLLKFESHLHFYTPQSPERQQPTVIGRTTKGFYFSLAHIFSPLKTKRSLLYLKTQSVPRCKHFSSRL